VPASRSRVRFDTTARTTDSRGARQSISSSVFAPAVAGSPGWDLSGPL